MDSQRSPHPGPQNLRMCCMANGVEVAEDTRLGTSRPSEREITPDNPGGSDAMTAILKQRQRGRREVSMRVMPREEHSASLCRLPRRAPGRAARLVGASSRYTEVAGSVPGQGTYEKKRMNAYKTRTTN